MGFFKCFLDLFENDTHGKKKQDRKHLRVDYERVKKIVIAAAGCVILCDFRGVFEHDADVLQQPWYVRL